MIAFKRFPCIHAPFNATAEPSPKQRGHSSRKTASLQVDRFGRRKRSHVSRRKRSYFTLDQLVGRVARARPLLHSPKDRGKISRNHHQLFLVGINHFGQGRINSLLKISIF